MLCIGIDWADAKHDVCIRDAADRRILAEFPIDHDAAGMAKFDEIVAALGAKSSECLVAIETPHGLLVGYLLQSGYVVYSIPPRAVDRSPALRCAQRGARDRDRHRQSDSKTDEFDARVLSDILCVDRDYHRPISADSPLAQELKSTSRQYRKLVDERTRLKNQLTACLKEYYPAALDLFSGLDCVIACSFLRAYPNAAVASAASLTELQAFFAAKGYSCPRKVPEIHEKLQAPAIPVADWQVRVSQRRMLLLVELLATLVSHIKAYEKRLSALLDQHEDAFIFRSLPNAGDPTAAWLLGETPALHQTQCGASVGDCRDKFDSANGMQALAGSCPVTVQSSKQRRIKFRVGCCKSFRNAMQQFARLSAQNQNGSPWAKAYLNTQISRGHSVSRATRALGNRWLAIIFRLWQDRVAYDEQVHLRNRAQRGRRVMA
jgi:transposase